MNNEDNAQARGHFIGCHFHASQSQWYYFCCESVAECVNTIWFVSSFLFSFLSLVCNLLASVYISLIYCTVLTNTFFSFISLHKIDACVHPLKKHFGMFYANNAQFAH